MTAFPLLGDLSAQVLDAFDVQDDDIAKVVSQQGFELSREAIVRVDHKNLHD